MNTLQSIWNGLDWSYLMNIVLSVVPSLLCITFHEVSHGYVAYRLGDTTAKDAGRLTLNPLKHIDPMGLLMMVVFKFGWAKPVPVNMMRFRSPKRGMALTALAGPVSNVLLAYVAVLFASASAAVYMCSCSKVVYYLWLFFFYLEIMSAGLAVFNLFPIPPLDGSKVLFAVLPDAWYGKLMRYERFGMVLLAVLLLTGVLDTPLGFLRDGLTGALEAIGTWPADLILNAFGA